MKNEYFVFQAKEAYLFASHRILSGNRLVLLFGDRDPAPKRPARPAGTLPFSQRYSFANILLGSGSSTVGSATPAQYVSPRSVRSAKLLPALESRRRTRVSASAPWQNRTMPVVQSEDVAVPRAVLKYGLEPEEGNRYQQFVRLLATFDPGTMLPFLQESFRVASVIPKSSAITTRK